MDRDRFWFTGLIVLIALTTIALFTSYPSLQELGVSKKSVVREEPRSPRPMPVVENYFSTGWDFRARSMEEQVFVICRNIESWETKLFRIGAAVNLCAHLGYHPPTIIVNHGRKDDFPIPDTYRDIPTLLQDVFPKLRVMSVGDVDSLLKTHLSKSIVIKGDTLFGSDSHTDSFPELTSNSIVFDGSWESWECIDDYKTPVFDQLEFHPVIYHHCRKTYPEFFDRRIFIKSIFCMDYDSLDEENIQCFISRKVTENQKVYIFLHQPVNEDKLIEKFGKDYQERFTIIVGECSQVLVYLGVFCREMLIDISPASWWIGFHGSYRGRTVYYIPTDKVSEKTIYPEWFSNKNT